MTTIAFVGLGNMGLPMAKNLLAAGFSVTGFDLSAEARAAFTEAGGRATDMLADAVVGADAVITMLPNGAIVRDVYQGEGGVFAHMKDGALLIDSSTIDVETSRTVAAAAEAQGAAMVDAPVSGGVSGAAAGTLAFMVGGTAEAYARAEPVLAPMAGKIVHAGAAGGGQAAKACNNMLLAISMIGVSEAFNLGRSLGLDDQTFFDIAANASGQCWSLTSYCPVPGPVPSAPSNNGYKPGFAAALMLKDLRLAASAIQDTGTNAPLGTHAAQLYQSMVDAGLGDTDFSGIINFLAEKADDAL